MIIKMLTELQRMNIVRTSTELENAIKNQLELKYITEIKKKKIHYRESTIEQKNGSVI